MSTPMCSRTTVLVLLFHLSIALASSANAQQAARSRGAAIFADRGQAQLVLEEGAGEGPAWHPAVGLLFSGHDGINRLTPDGKVAPFDTSVITNGLMFDMQGNLLRCEMRAGRVTRRQEHGTGKVDVLTDQYGGKPYNQPNDLALDSRGRIYFSDPVYGPRNQLKQFDEQGRPVEGVYRIDPDGTVTRIITHEVDRPNGLLVSPDDRFLFVADNNNNTIGGARILWRFDLQPDGSVDVASRKKLYDWGPGRGPDGLTQDTQGRLYVAAGRHKANLPYETVEEATEAGIYVFDFDGHLLAFAAIPRDEVTNCEFGGDDRKTLYITAGGTLWSLRTTAPGYVVTPKTSAD